MPPQPTPPAPFTAEPPAAALDDELRRAVCNVLDDFGRRVRQAHSYDEVDAHRDELAELIVELVRAADDA